jgi:hypothetical protein
LHGIEASVATTGRSSVAERAKRLIVDGLDCLPLPASGQTLERWRCLAAVAASDLALAKIFESHTDAVAIRHELGASTPVGEELLAVWAAEAPALSLGIDGQELAPGAQVTLDGAKAWCSGASFVDSALVTAHDSQGRRWLAEVSLHQMGITVDVSGWHAVGMRDTMTSTVTFDRASARLLGAPNAYLDRPGFWQGGAGIAACWYGAAAEVGARIQATQRGRDDPHAKAKLGAIDGHLAAAGALLREVASKMDDDPQRDVRHDVLRVRAFVAATAERVLQDAAFAVGPGPLTSDETLARLFADLPVFIRQVRGGHDLVAQAQALPSTEKSPWSL